MKSKLTKIWGIGLTVALLVMLIGAAIPVSASTLAWSPVGTPNPVKNQLVAGSTVDVLAIAPDGTTMFAYDNTNTAFYKSTDGGWKWDNTGFGGGLPAAAMVDMAVSPNYATDSTVIIAASAVAGAAIVYRSINGGKTFGAVGALGLLGVEYIASIDISPWYLGGTGIIVGTVDPGAAGDVFVFTTGGLAWTAQGLAEDAVAVAFSPNHMADAQYLALTTDGANTYLRTRFGTDLWNAGILAATITGQVATAGCMAFPDDYEWSSNNRVMVGIATGAATGDAYRIHGGLPGGVSTAYDLNVDGTGTQSAPVGSIAVKGAIADADVLVGQTDVGAIKRAHDPTTSTVTWRSSTKSPTGAGVTDAFWSPTTGDAYVATNGAGAALSRSVDGGVTWNQMALIAVSLAANLSITDLAVVNTNTMFLLMYDDADGLGTINAGDYSMLFKTTNGGSQWEQIWAVRTTAANEVMTILAPSPDYATDETLFIAMNTTRLWKTSNGGETFIGLTAPVAITALGVVDNTTYYTGHVNAFYKSGRWTAASTLGDTVTSIVVADDGTIYIGTNDGTIGTSTNDGKTFVPVGASQELSAGNNVLIALDPNYASNNYIYAGSDGATTNAAATDVGVFRWTVGTSTTWKQLDSGANWAAGNQLLCTGLALSADGSLYAASNDVAEGIRRSVAPQGPSAPVWAFEDVQTDLLALAQLSALNLVPGSNAMYAIASGVALGSYGYAFRVVAFEDILAVVPEISAPKDGTATPGTSVTLGWKKIDSPVSLTYTYEVSTDSTFAVYAGGTPLTVPKSGTGVTVTGLTSGTTYYWKVYVSAPIKSKDSTVWTFTPKLGAPSLQSPDYGDDDVLLKPTFSWLSVPGATSYELELADNPFFANASVKKPLTHTTWTWDVDLEYGSEYYWRARAVKKGNVSSWSEAVFTIITKEKEAGLAPAPPAPPPQITVQPTPPAPAPIVQVPPALPSPVTPAIIWAIIIIGAVLIIAVIVLIVRTRRIP